MKRISFNPRFLNETGDDLIPGKIHTIRQNYNFWKCFEGQEVALFTWEGKPYRSKQKVFCVKRVISVQKVHFTGCTFAIENKNIDGPTLARNDGFSKWAQMMNWFDNYPVGYMAIIHFTNFAYGGKA